MKPFNDRWRGMLTIGNAEEVAGIFRRLLSRKRFTFTQVKPDLLPALGGLPQMIDTRVEVHTRQKLLPKKKGVTISVRKDANSADICIPTTEYLVIYATTLPGPFAPYDCTYKNPYIAFDGDRVTIKYQTPCGDQKVEVFTLEVR